MPDFTLKVRGDTRDVQSELNKAGTSAEQFAQVLQKGQAAAAAYARSVTLTSKEAGALGRALGLTAGEAKKLVAAEKLTAEEARKLAQAQMQATAQTRGLKESASSAAGSLQTLAAGLQAAASAALIGKIAEVAAELITLADAASDAREGLDLMTGSHADEYIRDIQDATRGTVSEMDAAAAAQHLFATGLISTSEQAAEVVRVAARLGEAFGHMDLDTSIRQFESLAESMSARSARQFGIDIGLAKDRAAALMATTPGLTQEVANLQAIMEQASAKANLLEQTLDGADLAMQQSAAAAEDLKVAGGELVTEFFTPAIQGARNLVVGIRDLRSAQADYRQQAAATSETFDEYVAQLRLVGLAQEEAFGGPRAAGLGAQTDELERLTAEYERLRGAVEEAAAAEHQMTVSTGAAARAAADLGYRQETAAATAEDMAEAERAAAEAQREQEQAIRAATAALQDQLQEQQALADLTGELSGQFDYLGRTITVVSGASGDLAGQEEYIREQLAATNAELAEATYHMSALGDGTGALQQRIDDLTIMQAMWTDALARTNAELGSYETTITLTRLSQEDLQRVGEGFFDLLEATENKLSLAGDSYDALRLRYGMVDEAQLAVEDTMAHMGDLLSAQRISVEEAAAAWELLVTGQTDAANASLLAAEANVNVADGLTELEDKAMQTAAQVQTSSSDIATAQQQVADQASAIAEAQGLIQQSAEPAFGAIAATAPGAVEAMTPLAAQFSRLVGNLGLMPTLATESFAAVNAAAGLYVGGDTGIGMAAALIASMRNSWQYLLTHPNINLSATVTQTGAMPGGGVGHAAGGVTRLGEVSLVGEYGPELAVFPPGTQIIPAAATQSIRARGMAEGGIVGGGLGVLSGAPIEVNLLLDGARIARVLIDPLRREARAGGFDLAAVA